MWYIVLSIISVCIFVIIFVATLFYFGDMLFSLIRSRWVPYVPSFDRDLALMQDGLWLQANKTLLDLWCGDGKALRYLVKHYQLKQWIGYEISRHAVLLGKFLNWKNGIANITLIHQSLYTADLKKYDYIYCYLMPFVMENMEIWLQKNIKKDTIIIVNSFRFPHWTPYKIIKDARGRDKVFLYRK